MAKDKTSKKFNDGKHNGQRKLAPSGPSLHPETKRWVSIILFITLTLISFLALFNLAGPVGKLIMGLMSQAFGVLAFITPLILLAIALIIYYRDRLRIKGVNYFGAIIFILSLTALFNLFIPLEQMFDAIEAGNGGGYVGLILSYAFLNIMGFWASLIVVIALIIIGLLLIMNTSINDLADSETLLGRIIAAIQVKWYDLRYGEIEDEEKKETIEPEVSNTDNTDSEVEEVGEEKEVSFKSKALKGLKKLKPESAEPVLDQPKVKPIYKKVDVPLNLLDESSGRAVSGNIPMIKAKIQKTLGDFGIPVVMGEVHVGPTVTQYEFTPAEGIKLSRITALQDDLALALAAHPLRIEAPIPGKSAVGLEVPNTSVAMVRLKELLESPGFKTRKSNLQIALGKDVSGTAWSTPLEKMPHLLVAGATGSGKSVCLNTILISLLYQNGPDTLRIILVDPKKVELTLYEDTPHLLTPVITDVKKTVNALKWSVAEMERRYTLLQKMGKRNIESYNATVEEKMPYIVFIIDELADLMATSRNEVETLVIRLAQMARAVGIHLIVATQRPSVDVITGLIKANIPTRIAFAVASLMDSRTILDTGGAEKLVGKGDMLFSNPEHKRPVRLQGAFLSEGEVGRVVDYLKESGMKPDYQAGVVEKLAGAAGSTDFSDPDDGDEMFEEAKRVVIEMGRASTSLLQRKLKLGYSRAARIIDLLEEAGVIGPGDGARPREVLVKKEDYIEGLDVSDTELQTDYGNKEVVEEIIDEDEASNHGSIETNDEEVAEAVEAIVEEEEDSSKSKVVKADDDWLNG